MRIVGYIPVVHIVTVVPIVISSIPPGRTIPMIIPCRLPVCIVVGWFLVVSTPIASKSRGTSLVEVAPVGIVAIDVESPVAAIPTKRTVEVGNAHILVILISGLI